MLIVRKTTTVARRGRNLPPVQRRHGYIGEQLQRQAKPPDNGKAQFEALLSELHGRVRVTQICTAGEP